ncbi:MAG: hypothetical protein QOC92_1102 [Acidimicrobiaceae bacterium]
MPQAAHPFDIVAGTWRGEGEGSYPTIADFAYHEELVITPVPGKPLARWASTTRDATTGEPRHAEAGFLRSTPAGIEFVVAHGFGVVEVATGALRDGALTLSTNALQGTPTAKAVAHVDRAYELDGDTLRYTMSMAAVGVELTHHLSATLRRSP